MKGKRFFLVLGLMVFILAQSLVFAESSFAITAVPQDGIARYGQDEVEFIALRYVFENNSDFDRNVLSFNLTFKWYFGLNVEQVELYGVSASVLIGVFQPGNYQIVILDSLNLTVIGNASYIVQLVVKAIGNGRLGITLSNCEVQDAETGDIFYAEEQISTSHTVIDLYKDMHYLYTSPEQDTVYLFPGQEFNWYQSLDKVYFNSFSQTVVALYMYVYTNTDGNYYFPIWSGYVSGLINEGTLTTYQQFNNYYLLWTANTGEGIDMAYLGNAVMFNQMPIGCSTYFSSYLQIYEYHELFGEFTSYHSNQVSIISNTGFRCDVTGDSLVNELDYQLSAQYFMTCDYWDSQFNPQGEINVNRLALVFHWPTMFDLWRLGIWLENPDHPLVAYLRIGEEFTFSLEESSGEDSIEQDYESDIFDSTLVVTTPGNIVSVYGWLNEMPWTETKVLSQGQMMKWTNDIEPEVCEVSPKGSQNEFIFTLPQGLTQMRIGAAMVVTETTTGIDENKIIVPTQVRLENYPNPFNPITTISFDLTEKGMTSLMVYDINGRKVADLCHEIMEPGKYQFKFGGSELCSGMYFCVLKNKNQSISRKMLMLK
ncbi:T9SS type A sorting domain-containing protein [Patescibacteria group bacterium]|nr:T9SS type A sorting domain-containing protein [Patescibacteria group bacterium]